MTTDTDRLRNLLADDADVSGGVEVFSVLGNETRYRIVRLLAAADDELAVAEFEPLLEVGQSGISHALSMLSEVGLVERRKEGKWRYYRATPFAERLLDVLDAERDGE